MQYLQFTFKGLSTDTIEILIALLDHIGFSGFEQEESSLISIIEEDKFSSELFKNVIEQTNVTYTKSIITNINWNQKWESDYHPIDILHPVTGKFFVHLRAGFHPSKKEALYDLEVTPKMSFGTGHHATTYLMIEQMAKIDFKGKKVIDFGTGTAVLAILAEKMGAAEISAIDNDEWSIENAIENALANSCTKIKIEKADALSIGFQADILLANINLNIICAHLEAIKKVTTENAEILFSGIMLHDEQHLMSALKKENIKVKDVFHRNGWIAVLAGKE